MLERDPRAARHAARESARMAVRAFARDPTPAAAYMVHQAWQRVRLLDELHARRRADERAT